MVVQTVPEVRAAVGQARKRGLSVGLVPTMGALHTGHVSLIRAAHEETGWVAVSIFVNPTQFCPGEDFKRYPRSWEADLAICDRERVDLVFAPGPEVMYAPGFTTFVEVHGLQDVLCGASRPGHFRGVATVVLKLLNIVQPDVAFFGQKDAQQARLIGQMVRDLDVPVRLGVCPTAREQDGLALSSRNQYLDPCQRKEARVLFLALDSARQLIEQGERDPIVVARHLAERVGRAAGATLDYAVVVDPTTLRAPDRLHGEVLLALAVKFGGTRLIDNSLVPLPDE
jgi:pantoate--beta-alanine ligase